MRLSVYPPLWPGSLISCPCGSRNSVWWERLSSRWLFPSCSSVQYEDTDSQPSTCRCVYVFGRNESRVFVQLVMSVALIDRFCFKFSLSCLGIITFLIFSPSLCASRCWMTNTSASGSAAPHQRQKTVQTHTRRVSLMLFLVGSHQVYCGFSLVTCCAVRCS